MDIVPMGPGYGAERRGMMLADIAGDAAAYATVRAIFEEHLVLVFRNRQRVREIEFALSRRFGSPELIRSVHIAGGGEVTRGAAAAKMA